MTPEQTKAFVIRQWQFRQGYNGRKAIDYGGIAIRIIICLAVTGSMVAFSIEYIGR